MLFAFSNKWNDASIISNSHKKHIYGKQALLILDHAPWRRLLGGVNKQDIFFTYVLTHVQGLSQ